MAESPGPTLAILVVEDEWLLRDVLAMCLTLGPTQARPTCVRRLDRTMRYSRTDLARATRCVEELEHRTLRLRAVTRVRHERGLDTASAEALADLLDSVLHQAKADRDTVALALRLRQTDARG